MRPRTVIWIASIFLAGFVFIGVSHCGYRKLRQLSSLEHVAATIDRDFPGIDQISTATLESFLDSGDVLVVDCRAPEEFAVSHVPGAVNLETAAQVREHVASGESPAAILVYCSVGRRSAELVDELTRAGVTNAKNVRGSIFAWANENRRLVQPDGSPAAAVHPFNDTWGRLLREERRAQIGDDTSPAAD